MTSHRFTRLALGAAVLALTAQTTVATATPHPYRPATTPAPVPASADAVTRVQTQTAPVKVQVLNLPKGRSAIVDLPADAGDVFVSNPEVADAVLRTPRRIFVMGVNPGVSDAIFFDGMGRQIMNLSIRVDAPTDELADTVQKLFPHSHIEVQSLNGHVVLSGMAQNDAQADQVLRLAQTFVDKPENVVNLMTIAGKDQVTLKVRIVEVNRSSIKQLGLSTDITYNYGSQSYSFGRANTYGTNGQYYGGTGACYGQTGAKTTANNNTTTTGSNNSNTTTTTTDANTSSSVGYTENEIPNFNADGSPAQTFSGTGLTTGLDGVTPTGNMVKNSLDAAGTLVAGTSNVVSNVANTVFNTVRGTNNSSCLAAFERAGLARTLAEPDLTAISGESAKFLAGGEFPVPVGQDNQGRITVEFKPFGVGLAFTPVVMSNGRISLRLSTEVSELTNTGSFSLNNTFTIPALDVRRAETTVEMQSGSSLMIAGLLQSKYKQTVDSMPGLTSLPIIGALFRSRDFLSDETEMVVMVTPYIVSPTDPNAMQTPADNLQIADDASTMFLGRLNKVIRAKTGTPDSAPPAPLYAGPVGYVIE